MSQLTIRTFEDRGGLWFAIAYHQGQLVANGGPASARSERSAAQEAINALYKREEERQPPIASEVAPAVIPASGGDFGSGEWTRTRDIDTALQRWIHSRATGEKLPAVFIDYEDANGVVTAAREIIPTGIPEPSGGLFMSRGLLHAIDVAKDEPRHFRIDRIQRLRIIAEDHAV